MHASKQTEAGVGKSQFLLQFRSIGSRLGAGFGVVLILMLAMLFAAGLQLWRVQSHNAENERHTANLVLAQEWSALVRTNLDRALTASRLDAALGDDETMRGKMAPVINRLNEDMAATTTATTEVQKRLEGAEEGSPLAAQVAKINTSRARFVTLRAQVRDDIQMGEDASKRIDGELVPLSGAMLKSLNELTDSLKEQSGTSTSQLNAVVVQAGIVLAALCLIALVAGVAIAWLTTRAITQPMRDAVAIAQNIANGDLSHDFRTERPDEIGSMLRRLAQMQEKLRSAFAEISQAAELIEQASREVASGNADLSARTEQTAANLQQTASSMEELTGTMRATGESARTVNELAQSASNVAQRGGSVVSQVVNTMNEISDSSSRIASIIGVIDGIAFQTNILALNAAVEAARAGEQGRGFAVVASEVRALAQRSAAAAREIKGLIDASVTKVENGASQVQQAGSTMDEIVASISRVTTIIAEINAKSSEQTQGVGQINSAISQLDQMTQQNAALVEESTAAAESLRLQAQRLNEALAGFRLAAA